MPTWQIFADDGNSFRWESSPNQPPIDSKSPQPTSPRRLPSISDLFLQGISKLTEDQTHQTETPPTFRTGLGRSLVVKQSSLANALSILGGEEDALADNCQLSGRDYGGSFSNSMFQTGSGKAVNISSTGLVRAKTLLGLEKNYDDGGFKGFVQTSNQSKTSESLHLQSSSHLLMPNGEPNIGFEEAVSFSVSHFHLKSGLLRGEPEEVTPECARSAPRPPPIKFQTAGGKSISVSGDALQRARSLLGEPELGIFFAEGGEGDSVFPIGTGPSFKNETGPNASVSHDVTKVKQAKKNFISPVRTSNEKKCAVKLEKIGAASNLIEKFDAEEHDSTRKPYNEMPGLRKPLRRDSLKNGIGSKVNLTRRSSGGPLIDISNSIGMDKDNQTKVGGKRNLATRISASPFKRPRTSKFVTPLNKNLLIPNGLSSIAPQESYCKKTISTRYQHQAPRKYLKEYLGAPQPNQNTLESMSDRVTWMNPENAEMHMFQDGSRLDAIGADSFFYMLVQSGFSTKYLSKEWIGNHYKWIVWKLACYERCYPARFSGKLLTVSNVFEELKYRYEREVNHGHRSALKRILEGDAPASSMLVLCISSIHLKCGADIDPLPTSNGVDSSPEPRIELTDGWYSVNALLDEFLSMKLATGKLFVGQKLRICGAKLCGWVGPVSPLEASRTISLCLHINGTYRAHWADRLGFCKGCFTPLAFRCIKGGGGAVPCTLVGVTRIYPVLYRERLPNGRYVVRSERMETKIMQLYDHWLFNAQLRRNFSFVQRFVEDNRLYATNVAEGIMSEFQRGITNFQLENDQITDEGENLSKLLENAAEPEVIMAEMSSEQLAYFASYQAKQEAMRQSDMQKLIEKALEDAGLNGRDVTPFMRVRVVGLISKTDIRHCSRREGLITIWNPTEKQQSEVVEGQTYAIAGLTPLSSDANTIYLQARGSTTKWRPLSPSASEHFLPFFNPRKAILLSKLGEVPFSSEFDVAAFVVYVGEVYKTVHQKTQWVFVADDTTSELGPELSSGLLAISFCSPSLDCDSVTPINYNLTGSTVGFCNLIKRKKDHSNNIWVAEATKNSTYFLSYDNVHSAHLKDVAIASCKWATVSSSTIAKFKEKVLSIIVSKSGITSATVCGSVGLLKK